MKKQHNSSKNINLATPSTSEPVNACNGRVSWQQSPEDAGGGDVSSDKGWVYPIHDYLLTEPTLRYENTDEPNLLAVFILVEVAGRVQNPKKLARGIIWCRLYFGRYLKLFGASKSTVKRALRMLVDAGYVCRHDGPGDNAIYAGMTDLGRSLMRGPLERGSPVDPSSTDQKRGSPMNPQGVTHEPLRGSPMNPQGVTHDLVRVTSRENDVFDQKNKKNNDAISSPGAAPQTPVVSASQPGATPPGPQPEEEQEQEEQDEPEETEAQRFIGFYIDWYNITTGKSLKAISAIETKAIEDLFDVGEEDTISALYAAAVWIEAQRVAKLSAPNYNYYGCKNATSLGGLAKNWDRVVSDIESVDRDFSSRSTMDDLRAVRDHLRVISENDENLVDDILVEAFPDEVQELIDSNPKAKPASKPAPKPVAKPSADDQPWGQPEPRRRQPGEPLAPPPAQKLVSEAQAVYDKVAARLSPVKRQGGPLPEPPARASVVKPVGPDKEVILEVSDDCASDISAIQSIQATPAAPEQPKVTLASLEEQEAGLECDMRQLGTSQDERSRLTDELRAVRAQITQWKLDHPAPAPKPKAKLNTKTDRRFGPPQEGPSTAPGASLQPAKAPRTSVGTGKPPQAVLAARRSATRAGVDVCSTVETGIQRQD